jgi:hypothetical protein
MTYRAGHDNAGVQRQEVSISSVTCSLMEGFSASTRWVVKPDSNMDLQNSALQPCQLILKASAVCRCSQVQL